MRLVVLHVGCPFTVIPPEPAGEPESVLTQIDAKLVANDHDSIVLAPEGSCVEGILVSMPPPVDPLDRAARARVREQYRFVLGGFLDQWPIDIIHMHGADFHEYLPPAGLPVLATMHLPIEWHPEAIFHLDRPQTFLQCTSADQQKALGPRNPAVPVIETALPGTPAAAFMLEQYFRLYEQIVLDARTQQAEAALQLPRARAYAI